MEGWRGNIVRKEEEGEDDEQNCWVQEGPKFRERPANMKEEENFRSRKGRETRARAETLSAPGLVKGRR